MTTKKNGEGLTDQEADEFEGLCSDRAADVMSMIPVPMCCEAAQRYPAISFSVDYGDGDSNEAPGGWYIAKNRELETRGPDHHREPPAPKFCPYCGTSLPVMRRKVPAPKTVCRIIDGGYYCNTCRERLGGCLCDPLSSAFEVVP